MFFLKPKVRVRFAPSPTGFLHVGGLRTALYNYLFAKKNHGTYLLRIEDTDRTRTVLGGVENILRTLSAVNLNPEEGPRLGALGGIIEKGKYGPYLQSNRLGLYQHFSEELLEKGGAYRCFCQSERLEELRRKQEAGGQPLKYDRKCLGLSPEDIRRKVLAKEKNVIRQRMPDFGQTEFEDMIHGSIKVENSILEDQILIKADGYPTYNFANVIDDHEMKISHVIRGEEFISSTPKHVLLYRSLGWKLPQFAHLPLLLNADRSKLSKRQGDVAVEDYLKKGYLPEAILNFIALLGWNPSGEREIFSLRELVSSFEIKHVNKSGAIFDVAKLDWLNGMYIRELSEKELVKRAWPFLEAAHIPLDDFNKLTRAARLEQERIKHLDELPGAIKFLFAEHLEYDAHILVWKKMKKEDVQERLSALKEFLQTINENDWQEQNLEKKIKSWIGSKGISTGEVLWPMRVALTGREASPPPFAVADVLGKKNCLERILKAISLAETL